MKGKPHFIPAPNAIIRPERIDLPYNVFRMSQWFIICML